jgi:prophage antirepressor-like protein
MGDLIPFDFGDKSMRFGVTADEIPFVVTADMAKALGYRAARDLARLVADEEKGEHLVRTPGGDQRMSVLYEYGIYEAIFLSRRPEAAAFKARVKEILREIRTNGGYISPTATEDQLAGIISRAESQAKVLSALKGIVNREWLEAKARHVAARALGEEPEINHLDRPLTVGEYLEDKGVTGEALRSLSPRFGKALKAAFVDRYDRKPATVDRFVDGALRKVAGYTERHRPLFDQVWRELSAVTS